MSELKPCPFCGGEAKTIKNAVGTLFWVYCWKCGARSDSYTIEYEQKAIDAWNTRAERTCINRRIEPDIFECSECGGDCRGIYGDVFRYCPYCGAKVVE